MVSCFILQSGPTAFTRLWKLFQPALSLFLSGMCSCFFFLFSEVRVIISCWTEFMSFFRYFTFFFSLKNAYVDTSPPNFTGLVGEPLELLELDELLSLSSVSDRCE